MIQRMLAIWSLVPLPFPQKLIQSKSNLKLSPSTAPHTYQECYLVVVLTVSMHLKCSMATCSGQSRFPGGSVVKNQPANEGDPGDVGSRSGSERSPIGGNGNPLQYSCLENPIDKSLVGYNWWGC